MQKQNGRNGTEAPKLFSTTKWEEKIRLHIFRIWRCVAACQQKIIKIDIYNNKTNNNKKQGLGGGRKNKMQMPPRSELGIAGVRIGVATNPPRGYQTNGSEIASMNEWMNENLYIAHKKTSTQNLACSQRQIHTAHTCKLSQAKTTKGHALRYPPLSESGTMHNS